MRAKVDPELCILCGLCAETCPTVFELGPKSSEVKLDPIPEDQKDCTRTAAENCPTEAIAVED